MDALLLLTPHASTSPAGVRARLLPTLAASLPFAADASCRPPPSTLTTVWSSMRTSSSNSATRSWTTTSMMTRRTTPAATPALAPAATTLRASDFGLMKADRNGRITDFLEKPKGESLKSMQVDTDLFGLFPEFADTYKYMASMGIYVFKADVL